MGGIWDEGKMGYGQGWSKTWIGKNKIWSVEMVRRVMSLTSAVCLSYRLCIRLAVG